MQMSSNLRGTAEEFQSMQAGCTVDSRLLLALSSGRWWRWRLMTRLARYLTAPRYPSPSHAQQTDSANGFVFIIKFISASSAHITIYIQNAGHRKTIKTRESKNLNIWIWIFEYSSTKPDCLESHFTFPQVYNLGYARVFGDRLYANRAVNDKTCTVVNCALYPSHLL